MYGFTGEQRFEITDVFRDNDAIFGDAAIFHRVVELSSTADVKRMNGVVPVRRQIERDLWRQAFVDEEAHDRLCRRALRAWRSTRQRMALGEDDRRFDRFRRQIRVLGDQIFNTVAVLDAGR